MTDDFRSHSSETRTLTIERPQSDHSIIVSTDISTAISLTFGVIANLNGIAASCGDVIPTSLLQKLHNLRVCTGIFSHKYVPSCGNVSVQVSPVVNDLRGVIRCRVTILIDRPQPDSRGLMKVARAHGSKVRAKFFFRT
jgi:hypothetical protein